MERPQWDRIQEIYYSALRKARSERSAFVASACDHDPVLVRKVSSLLEADDSLSDFLESPVFELGLKIIGSDSASPIGMTIGNRYLVEAKLGEGGIGRVYLARDLELHHRRVVIKILSHASLQDPYVLKKFNQEVEALSRIDHPNVVGVLDAGKLPDGKPYIVMQYVDGVTLRSRITSEGMDLDRAASILKQIGAALDHVHAKGILHRDLKPENIMLQVLNDGTEMVKIVDFGIAKVKDSVVGPSTINNVPFGTVVYMSPEQLRGDDNITAASDIFSMGVIAYEMVTGRKPFNPVSAPQLLEIQRAGVPVKPIALRANLSTEAQAIILRALSFAPANRYKSASEFAKSLARALMNERHIPAHPPVDKSSRRFVLKAIGGFLIIAALVGLLLSVYKYRASDETASSTAGPSHSFTYWLTVQKMRDGKPYQDPFQSNGQDTFENGDNFRLNVSSGHLGYLYVFNEGPPEPGRTSFTIIFPTPEINDGSAMLGVNQPVQSNWITFRGPAGSENFWIAWSPAPVSELESVKTEAFTPSSGGLTDPRIAAVRSFLQKKQSETKVRTTRYKKSQVAVVSGPGDVLVKHVQFQHR